MVPLLAGWLGMPLKRALGTSLLAIVALVVGSVPGARLGAAIALGARERTLRVVVGCGLLAVSILYAIEQASAMLDS